MVGGLPCHRTLQTTCLGDYQSWDWLYSQVTWVGQLAFLLNKREVRKQKHTDSSFTLSLNYFGETPRELWKVCEGTCGHRCRAGPWWRLFGACSALRSWERLLFTHDICVTVSRWTEWCCKDFLSHFYFSVPFLLLVIPESRTNWGLKKGEIFCIFNFIEIFIWEPGVGWKDVYFPKT